MANKTLFASTQAGAYVPPADSKNHAGGAAYALNAKESLAKYAATGFFGDTYYVTAAEQLQEVIKLCAQLDDEFIAKCAVYAREKGYLKDMPALLLAILAGRKTPESARALASAWPRVIDNAKMLRNFMQVIRSGQAGRKSFGTATKRLIQQWIIGRRPESLFRDSVGNDPSLADVIKMVHPRPDSPEREVLYRYLIGKGDTILKPELLPDVIKQYEEFKRAKKAGETPASVPDVEFRLLDSLQLTDAEWTAVAKHAPWQMTRMNLNTFQRHGVFKDPAMVKMIADRLRNPELIKRARCFPYQLLMAYKAVLPELPAYSWASVTPSPDALPREIIEALQDAMEIATENAPTFDSHIVVCPDVSGSMHSPVTGSRGAATSKVRCVDVAGLVAAVIARKAKSAALLPFDTDIRPYRFNPRDSIMTIAEGLAKFGGGGTNCAIPMTLLNRQSIKGIDAVIYISDNESWVQPPGSYRYGSTAMANEWATLKQRNPLAKLVCIDLTPNTTAQVPTQTRDTLNIAGFSDTVFDVIREFIAGTTKSHVAAIEALRFDLE